MGRQETFLEALPDVRPAQKFATMMLAELDKRAKTWYNQRALSRSEDRATQRCDPSAAPEDL